jgi:uncharacterized SAM-binding protein YcdF (DUF218 family)
MFILKKIFAPLLFPVPLVLAFVGFGLILLWFSKKQKTGKTFVTIGFFLLIVLSLNPVSTSLIRPLEEDYQPVLSKSEPNVHWVVVLDAGHVSDPRFPVTTQLWESTLCRLVEGIRLHKERAGSKLIVSGGKVFDPVPGADMMADVAKMLGVNPQDLILENKSRDTREEAYYVRPIVKEDPFFLVTSATHMPRAMKIFQQERMNPIAAPTDYLVKSSGKWTPGRFIPSAGALGLAERAFYERIGLLWTVLSK